MKETLIPPDIIQPILEILTYVFTAALGWVAAILRGKNHVKPKNNKQ